MRTDLDPSFGVALERPGRDLHGAHRRRVREVRFDSCPVEAYARVAATRAEIVDTCRWLRAFDARPWIENVNGERFEARRCERRPSSRPRRSARECENARVLVPKATKSGDINRMSKQREVSRANGRAGVRIDVGPRVEIDVDRCAKAGESSEKWWTETERRIRKSRTARRSGDGGLSRRSARAQGR